MGADSYSDVTVLRGRSATCVNYAALRYAASSLRHLLSHTHVLHHRSKHADSSGQAATPPTRTENITSLFFAGSSSEDEVENPDNHFIFDPLASDDEADAMLEAVNEQVQRSGNIDW